MASGDASQKSCKYKVKTRFFTLCNALSEREIHILFCLAVILLHRFCFQNKTMQVFGAGIFQVRTRMDCKMDTDMGQNKI